MQQALEGPEVKAHKSVKPHISEYFVELDNKIYSLANRQ